MSRDYKEYMKKTYGIADHKFIEKKFQHLFVYKQTIC